MNELYLECLANISLRMKAEGDGPFSSNSIVVWTEVSSLVMINVRVGEQPSFLLYFNFVLLKAAVFDLFSSQILNLLTNNRSYLVQSLPW